MPETRAFAAIAAAPPTLRAQYAALVAALQGHARMLVAYSGGVDSTLVLRVAVLALGPERVLAVLADSPSLARREKHEAEAMAGAMGARLRILDTHELDDPRYASNPLNRCYFCKSELYARLHALAAAEDYPVIADGTNLDDLGETRPGRAAAQEHGVQSPLLEAGLRKDDVRALSRLLELPTAEKPATPCLASRIPFGQKVDVATLAKVEAAEEVLRVSGILGGRVRHHGDLARLELPPQAIDRLSDVELRQRLTTGVRQAGYLYVTLDLEAYRSGRLTETEPRSLPADEPPVFDA